MNIAQLARDLGLAESEYREILELFAVTARMDSQRIGTAVAIGDARGVASVTHSLGWAAGNLGLFAVANDARFIEEKSREGQLHETRDAVAALEKHLADIARLLDGETVIQ